MSAFQGHGKLFIDGQELRPIRALSVAFDTAGEAADKTAFALMDFNRTITGFGRMNAATASGRISVRGWLFGWSGSKTRRLIRQLKTRKIEL
jgi:hypothetical protein